MAKRVAADANRKHGRLDTTAEQRSRYMRALALRRWAKIGKRRRSELGRQAIMVRWAKKYA
jgi:hypothetical protein